MSARAIRVIGFGWTGSSLVYEDLRRSEKLFVVSNGRDGETCNFVKQINPQSFCRRHGSPVTPTDALCLLTGGRSAEIEALSPSAKALAYLNTFHRYVSAQRASLGDVNLSSLQRQVLQNIPCDGKWKRIHTKSLISSIALDAGKSAYLQNNDPNLRGLRVSDFFDGGVIIFVFRGARDQYIDYGEKQWLKKRGLEVTTLQFVRFALGGLRDRIIALLVCHIAQIFNAPIIAVNFESYVADRPTREAVHRLVDPELPDDVDFVQDSRKNIHLNPKRRLTRWENLACQVLSFLRPRDAIESAPPVE